MIITRALSESRRGDVAEVGGKAANLGDMIAAGFPVPGGFTLTTDAFRRFVGDAGIGERIVRASSEADPARAEALAAGLIAAAPLSEDLAREIRDRYHELGPDAPVAVRSSATAEDLADASFAGQQETLLNVRGIDAVLDAVRACWASLWTARAVDYRRRRGIAPADVALAVVVQAMTDADASGVLFTANPENGRRGELAISAAWGLGESVVGGSVTPDLVVVDAAARRVLRRETHDKAVMTVPREAGTAEIPVPDARRAAPVLSDADALRLADVGVRLQEHFGVPQDVEWAIAGGDVVVLQSRPITALPDPVGEVPTEWPIDDPTGMYVRASIIEQLPEPLTPLFADLIPEPVVDTLQSLFRELLGVRMDGVEFPIINGYPFYYYSRRTFLSLLAQTPRLVRPMVSSRGRFRPIERWRDTSLPRYRAIVEPWRSRDLRPLSDADLLAGLKGLLRAGCEYYTAVQTVIPFTSMSEIIFSSAYEQTARRAGDPEPAAFLVGFDAQPIRADKAVHDLARWASGQPGLPDALRAGDLSGVDDAVAAAWGGRLDAYLAEFGHATANLDFAAPVPADTPEPVLDAVRFYLEPGAPDPHARQARLASERDRATGALLARLDPARRAAFRRLVARAQLDAPTREEALAHQGLAWPAMRRIVREFGRRLVTRDALDAVDDAFWVREAELAASEDLRGAVEERRAAWRGRRRATPPQIMPEAQWLRWFGDLMPARTDAPEGGTIRGTASSGGEATGPARVIGGPEDFGSMRPGEVLVAAITTPAFTPLFAKALAVVTDVGGPLSHSSIVAREYGIPAVLGTGVATTRIATGDRVTVDGQRGVVRLADAPPSAPAERRRRGWGPVAVGAGALGTALLVRRLARARR